MKVLFLDIDGVLNSHRSLVAYGGYPHAGNPRIDRFDDVALRLVRGIVRTANAHVVLSSSWRIISGWEKLATLLDLPIVDRTPSLNGKRGQEIASWLRMHPEVTSYAIVDDDSDMLDSQRPFFVKTSHFDGLDWQGACRLAGLLGISIYDVNHPKDAP